MSNITKEEKIKGTFFGAIVADALCLGSHYEYDAKLLTLQTSFRTG
jgi:ADP-ribosylglycohydrolase